MATVVSGNGRSCGALIAVILGLMGVTLQGAALRSAQDVVALGHDSMESPLLFLDSPMRSKMRWESVLFWSNSYPQFPIANDRWCVQPCVLSRSRACCSQTSYTQGTHCETFPNGETTGGHGEAHH